MPSGSGWRSASGVATQSNPPEADEPQTIDQRIWNFDRIYRIDRMGDEKNKRTLSVS